MLRLLIVLVILGVVYSYTDPLVDKMLSNNGGYLRGVNLGSWFIPEFWMVDFYANSNSSDFCTICRNDRANADARMRTHLDSWISESDFQWLSTQKVNTIRLPVGYWNVIPDVYGIYVPVNPSESIKYIDKAFDWAEKYGMSVLLDLHGAPGSQNGNDHSGCATGVVGWNTPKNIDISLQAITKLAQLYGKRSNLLGIELLNEPAWTLEANNHEELVAYYRSSYQAIRKYSSSALVAFNVLYSDFYDLWDGEFPSSSYPGMIIDWHLYDCFGDQNLTIEQHISNANSWGPMIAEHSQYHPIYVGEWSLGGAKSTDPVGKSSLFL